VLIDNCNPNTIGREQDAQYYYSLARTEIGQNQLQGYDYFYNLQGWMKGINAIENANDPGQDGITGVNASFAKDLTAFSLEYFNNDYAAINSSTPLASVDVSSHAATNSSALYNGNIRYMQTRLTNPTTGEAMPMLNAYQYDQLNRLKESRSYETGLSSNVWNPITYGNEYYNAFNFDAMGNILHQDRHLRDGTKIENMTYQYQYEDPTNHERLMRNRLYHINDDIASTVNTSDIDDMGTFDSDHEDININNNYSYDEEGRLVRDNQEGISKIVWRVDGKVKEIQRVGEDKKWLRFDYDAMGHRIAKHVYDNTGTTLEKSTYYVLDAQGNQVSMYEHEVASETAQYNLVERNIYGSSRLGTFTKSFNLLSYTTNTSNISQVNGFKQYEFTNHLGNVLTVFSDIKIPLDENPDGVVDGHSVCIRNVSDYSPFGVSLDGRTIQSDFYRHGFNGMEKDDELKGMGNSYDFGARMYDSRVGRFLKIDDFSNKFPSKTPYSFAGNIPLLCIDNNGDSVLFYSASGKYLGYSNDNSRYEGINLLVIIEDKNVKGFNKSYLEKTIGRRNNDPSDDKKTEALVSGLESMGMAIDVTNLLSFVKKYTFRSKLDDGTVAIRKGMEYPEMEWGSSLDPVENPVTGKMNLIRINDVNITTDGIINKVAMIRESTSVGDFHLHTGLLDGKFSRDDLVHNKSTFRGGETKRLFGMGQLNLPGKNHSFQFSYFTSNGNDPQILMITLDKNSFKDKKALSIGVTNKKN